VNAPVNFSIQYDDYRYSVAASAIVGHICFRTLDALVFVGGYVFDGFQLFELILNELPITGGSVGSSIQECVQSICSLFYIVKEAWRGVVVIWSCRGPPVWVGDPKSRWGVGRFRDGNVVVKIICNVHSEAPSEIKNLLQNSSGAAADS
jgi:hypothetical protein